MGITEDKNQHWCGFHREPSDALRKAITQSGQQLVEQADSRGLYYQIVSGNKDIGNIQNSTSEAVSKVQAN